MVRNVQTLTVCGRFSRHSGVGIVATDNDFFTVITKLCNSVTEYRYYICVALNLAIAIILCCNFSLVFPA